MANEAEDFDAFTHEQLAVAADETRNEYQRGVITQEQQDARIAAIDVAARKRPQIIKASMNLG